MMLSRAICALFLWAALQAPCFSLSAPMLVSPQNGEVIQLAPASNQLTFSWSYVSDATGYLMVLSGPPEFGDPLEIPVNAVNSNPVSRNVNNLSTGSYSWSVRALKAGQSLVSQTWFFTVQTGTTPGGDLPAPALLLPPPNLFLRGDSGQIQFQWTRVNEAKGYKVRLNPPSGGLIDIPQPAAGKTVTMERNFPQFQAGAFIWSVTPYDSQSRLGDGAAPREFVFTTVDGEAWDLDDSGAVSPGDLFAFASNWEKGLTAADLNADGKTDVRDVTLFCSAWQGNPPPSPTPIPGFVAPSQIQPVTHATVAANNVVFAWQPIIGASGYEFNLMDNANDGQDIARIIAQPVSGNVTTTVGFLSARPRTWRVRAIFSSGAFGPFSGAIPFNVSSGKALKKK